MKIMKKDRKIFRCEAWVAIPHASRLMPYAPVNKNIPIFYDLLIKSLLLLTDYKNMNKEIKKLLRCIKHLSLRPDLSFCEFN